MQIIDANGNMFGYDHLEIIGIDGKPKTTGGGGGGPYVPYTGATGNVDLGEYELKAGQFTLDTSPTGTAVVGTTQWNNTIGSSQTTLKGGTVILKNGVDLVARVVNKVTPNATLTRANYTAVRVSGAQGQRLAVAYAQANTDNNSADTIGLVIETIATNQEGFIMTVGQLDEVNTTGSLQGETWADGDVLYLSPTTAGLLTNIKPTGLTGHIVVMGYVEYAHAIHGSIYVKIMNGWELDELHNVYINPATLANNDLLQYDSASSLWKNESLSNAGVQPTLVSGTNIKTVNSTSLLGSGDVSVGVTSVTGTSPITSSGGATPAISIATANTSTTGALTSTDWNTFNGKQAPLVSGTNIKTINGNSVLGSGNLTISGGGGVHGFLTPSGMGVTAMVITSGTNTAVPASNTMYAYPIIMAKDYTFNSMQMYCQSLLAGSLARILVYSDLNSAPDSKIYESTNIDLSTTGTKTITNTMTFTKGTIYWMVLHCGNGGAPLLIRSMSSLTTMPIGYQSNNATYNLISKSSIPLGSAPTTFGASSVSTINAPLIALFQ